LHAREQDTKNTNRIKEQTNIQHSAFNVQQRCGKTQRDVQQQVQHATG